MAMLGAFTASATAQTIVMPQNHGPTDTGCLVKGLDPNGDGFLALRAGPGTEHAQIGSLHNGDAAFVYGSDNGRWLYVENGALDGKEAKFRGWIYDAWCEFYP
ncbi:SH3 domain-containing protein [Maritimibacter sp. DP4N28-5]|uniref:SH3 domain-containing protein n=1 Tax=Maritimibacter dapengensis TaxID=2836868 RepID=A0ABS6T142_9RHOB|nr:SH3 domain-containing protein [Maritimibacter dapengensis]